MARGGQSIGVTGVSPPGRAGALPAKSDRGPNAVGRYVEAKGLSAQWWTKRNS